MFLLLRHDVRATSRLNSCIFSSCSLYRRACRTCSSTLSRSSCRPCPRLLYSALAIVRYRARSREEQKSPLALKEIKGIEQSPAGGNLTGSSLIPDLLLVYLSETLSPIAILPMAILLKVRTIRKRTEREEQCEVIVREEFDGLAATTSISQVDSHASRSGLPSGLRPCGQASRSLY